MIEGKRLLLRHWKLPEDVAAAHEFYSDPEVSRYIDQNFLTEMNEVEGRLRHYIQHQTEYGFSAWAVVEKQSGKVIGIAGLVTYNEHKEPELGYIISRMAWGKGFATEAARLCLEVGFGQLNLDRIIAIPPHGNNGASRKVLEKVGFRLIPEKKLSNEKQLYVIRNREWSG
jgi:[ribosomal protein S5]-alanine N-acetyltransferase